MKTENKKTKEVKADRILISRDEDAIAHSRAAIQWMIKKHFEPISGEMHRLGIDVTTETLKAVISDNYVEKMFRVRAKKETELMPAVTPIVFERYTGEMLRIKELTAECMKCIRGGHVPYRIPDSIDPNLDFFLRNIVVTPEVRILESPDFMEFITEASSEYIESPERLEVYQKAQEVITSIEILKNVIEKSRKKYPSELMPEYENMYRTAQIIPIGDDTSHYCIITIDSKGVPTLNLEAFLKIR